jgi:RHS repeat-associated protein
VDGSTLHVDYAYDDATGTYNGITSVFTKGMRPKSIKYPDGRLVHYTYGTGGGLDDALSRVAAIYNDNGGSPGSTAYAAYKYAGDGRIVQEAFAEPDLPEGPPSGKLTHIGAGNKADAPWHGHLARESQGRPGRALANSHGRDARVTHGQDAHATHGRDAHATPAASAAGQRDEAYAYDRLNRLVGTKRGILPSGTYQAPYPGDVTGNGVVDGSDSSVITANLNNSSRRWASGDLDGNGLVNSDDSAIYTANAGTPTGSVAAGRAWTLDATGNWSAYKQDNGDGQGGSADGDYADACDLDQSRDHNLANEIADGPDGDSYAIETTNGTAWADPVYDARGNMTTVPRPGDMTAVYTCTYDAWNRLVKVVAGQTTVAEYRYDGLNRRIRKYTDKSGDNWTVREYYYNVSWQTLQIDKETEDRTGGVEPAVADALNEQYVWSLRYVDAPILRDRDSDSDGDPDDGDLGKTDSGLDERLYYLTDVNMNVTALVDTGGDAVERYTYDAYGRVTIYDGTWTNTQSAATYANEVLYCGYRFDSETGLYHVRNRMYHPLLGRWLQRDPLGYVDGMGLYEYVKSSPAVQSDPLGEKVTVSGSAADRTAAENALQKLAPGAKVDKKTGNVTLDEPKTKTEKDDCIAKSRGIELLKRLVKDDNSITIDVTKAGGNSASPADMKKATDSKGKGSDATVNWNPKSDPDIPTVQKDGSVKNEKRPTQIGLGHELIHVDNMSQGTLETKSKTYTDLSGQKQTTRTEEVNVVGCEKNATPHGVTENNLRKEQGVQPRARY